MKCAGINHSCNLAERKGGGRQVDDRPVKRREEHSGVMVGKGRGISTRVHPATTPECYIAQSSSVCARVLKQVLVSLPSQPCAKAGGVSSARQLGVVRPCQLLHFSKCAITSHHYHAHCCSNLRCERGKLRHLLSAFLRYVNHSAAQQREEGLAESSDDLIYHSYAARLQHDCAHVALFRLHRFFGGISCIGKEGPLLLHILQYLFHTSSRSNEGKARKSYLSLFTSAQCIFHTCKCRPLAVNSPNKHDRVAPLFVAPKLCSSYFCFTFAMLCHVQARLQCEG
mmetsp:Transcript_30183/g.77989  ORF Transcript_30183/g.77989 Transcript_30183/m.77989 type:complete len:283 (-) Transcript_30183:1123-1971(-)